MSTRFQLTTDDFHHHDNEESSDYYRDAIEHIPILKRRAAASAASSAERGHDDVEKRSGDPICVIVVGMAGSGKTTLMAQLQKSLNLRSRRMEDVGGEGGEDVGEKEEQEEKPKTTTTTPTTETEAKIVTEARIATETEATIKETTTTSFQSSSSSRTGYCINLDPAGEGGEDVGEKEEQEEKPKTTTTTPTTETEAKRIATETGPTIKETTTTSFQSSSSSRTGYCINLDPAAKYVPFQSSIDIRDTVDYLEVMRQHKLGPNGAILTCLNLFATKFDQVMSILERRCFGSTETDAPANPSSDSSPPNYILVDTPGQIEAFTWSASGSIATSALATAFPTVLAFVVDTPRCAASVHTFMSNMLYACSMLYRAKLPMVLVWNKTDVV
eukprot:CAMPEP_0171415744 /NCGR_PEP_ID=MMETSP0880-20121228/39741_1 /TAXON_ID=67004 /ORGANISM="Thalassiosira weissflogii, Strain CCMP1336" /LENGTH=385 /DNA_ID=CAMNT_0011933975 /DNA_START=17 /DNA_END=1170 /DNA_ORIENTATION=-